MFPLSLSLINPSLSLSSSCSTQTKQSLPLMEYVYNVVRFIDAILSNNATDDHCKEFVKQGVLSFTTSRELFF